MILLCLLTLRVGGLFAASTVPVLQGTSPGGANAERPIGLLEHPFLVGFALLLLVIALVWARALLRKRIPGMAGAPGAVGEEAARDASVRRNFSFAGGVAGLFLFFFLGLVPAILYGAFVGRTLATGILGLSGESHPLFSAIVLFGMLLGILATGGLFVVVGGALGAIFYLVWTRFSGRSPGGQGGSATGG